MDNKIAALIKKASEKDASDLYIREHFYPYIRNRAGKIELLETSLTTGGQIADFLNDFQTCSSDFAYSAEGISCRCHSYIILQGAAIAVRLLPKKIPSMNRLGLPSHLEALTDIKSGLIVVSGPTGSGKSTTLAAILNAVSLKHPYHIITLEEPIEYVLSDSKSIISQIEIDTGSFTFADGVKAAMRENPDVIMIGEIRTLEDIKTALFAAESGHLVLTSIHSSGVIDALDRLVNYEDNLQMKNMFANCFQAIIVQKLLPAEKGKILCCEILLRNPAAVNCIKNNTCAQLINIMKAAPGMTTMEDYLNDLKERGAVPRSMMI